MIYIAIITAITLYLYISHLHEQIRELQVETLRLKRENELGRK